ncbi:hypothetical protein [Mangrovibacillus cuniculi]|uniref:Uncharacterized protein n=1 Tax=Mangrovibacillus cuniculi TaxID=2593652 RepID=A0A7S8CBV0_9BACI|nr:hypothetical protein [Mangrovibacillus cuniculi]QPC47100.1 hypothetical protein G8O30_09040 [Mangrovibacillus cuniculi]
MDTNELKVIVNMIKNTFESELENEPTILIGADAQNYVDSMEELYLSKGVSLKKQFKCSNGMYLWWFNDNTIILKQNFRVKTLAHELRHAWQFENNEDGEFRFIEGVIEKNPILYYFSSKERDARKFARKVKSRVKGLNIGH